MFTYENKDTENTLETYEWDNVWWEQTAKNDCKRIMYIGDSISCGARRHITWLSKDKIICDGFGTSKALDNPFFKDSVALAIKQQAKCDGILFNNGLHGWHLKDEEYEKHYDEMLQFLLTFNTPVYVVLTTDELNNKDRGETVKKRNEIASKLAKKYALPVIDLYTVAVENSDRHIPDGVHFDEAGNELLAKKIIETL